MTPDVFRRRRDALARSSPGAVFVLPAAPHALRNRTVFHAYRHDSDLYYLTGLEERDARLVLRADGSAVLYTVEPDPERTRWEGRTLSLDEAGARSGIDDVRPLARFGEELPDHVRSGESVAFRLGRNPSLDAL